MNRSGNQKRRKAAAMAVCAAVFLLLSAGQGLARPGDPVAVTFQSADGKTLHGKLFGTGSTGVVLAHMFPADQGSWSALARALAGQGYRVLTFDFRGFGESGGEKEVSRGDQDLEGACRFLEPLVKRIFLVGASMGGTAAIIVASRRPVAGVACLSAPVAFRGLDAERAAAGLSVPLLLVASEGDVNTVMAARWIEHVAGSAASPPRVLVFPGADHGTRLLQGGQGKRVEAVLLRFLEEQGGAGASPRDAAAGP